MPTKKLTLKQQIEKLNQKLEHKRLKQRVWIADKRARIKATGGKN